MVFFNEYVKNLRYIHDDDIINVSDAYLKLYNYDIVSFNSYKMLKPGDTPFIIRDYIDTITNYNNIYIVVNNKEIPINENTKLLLFLTPLNTILLRNKNNQDVVITFRKYVMKNDLSEALLYTIVEDSELEYYYGCVHNKEKYNTLELRT